MNFNWNPPDPYDHLPEWNQEDNEPPDPCPTCKGTGISLGFGNVIIGCNDCDGTGYAEQYNKSEIKEGYGEIPF